MSQRLRTCSKTTNFETINCEGYRNCLTKDRPRKQKCIQRCDCSRDRSLCNSKPSLVAHFAAPSHLNLRPGCVKQHNLPSKISSASSNVIRKELVSDNSALVEVTVRAKANRKSRSESKTEPRHPWSQLLKASESNEVVTFHQFDPLRTLHFLGKELSSALKSNTPGNIDVSKILAEMMDALNRLPPEVAGITQKNHKRSSNTNTKSANVHERPLNLLYNPRVEHKICQTVIDNSLFVRTETVQRMLEESIKDLDEKCKEMENLCKNLKMDKQLLEKQLVSEKDTVRFLRNQMEDLQTEQISSKGSTLPQLVKENDILKTQQKSLQHQIESQLFSIKELKAEVDDLQTQKQTFEQENITLRHNLTISKLEKEKHLTILSVRDRQIKEILGEMNQLQEVVNDELLEFQNKPFISQPSSQSTVLGNWQQVLNEAELNNYGKEMGDTAKVLFPTSDFLVNQFLYSKGTESFFDIPSGNTSLSNFGSVDTISKNLNDSEVPSKLISVSHR